MRDEDSRTGSMAQSTPLVLAGAGGMDIADFATDHSGRKAILLTRDKDTWEFEELAETMGLDIIEVIFQSGNEDPHGFFGKGRLQDVGDELSQSPKGHPWNGIDLVLVHQNASPRQLVSISKVVGVEVWDRVRLLLALFTTHASSVEARTQVRLARLRADRSVLREVVRRETTGERLGFGAGGKTGWSGILEVVGREVASLQKRQRRHAASQAERRRQRRRTGAKTVGLAGYTNAGKSSLFRVLSGKEVLVEDKLFSTLETTVGRMQASPRILLADTIGFIDRVPAELLDAFKATLSESLECDLLLLLADVGDEPIEIERKLCTSRRDLLDRMDAEDSPEGFVVLTKCDLASPEQYDVAKKIVEDLALPSAVVVSSFSGEGIAQLRDMILLKIYGLPHSLLLKNVDGGLAIPAIVSRLHDIGLVTNTSFQGENKVITLWADRVSIAKLMAKSPNQIEVMKANYQSPKNIGDAHSQKVEEE